MYITQSFISLFALFNLYLVRVRREAWAGKKRRITHLHNIKATPKGKAFLNYCAHTWSHDDENEKTKKSDSQNV